MEFKDKNELYINDFLLYKNCYKGNKNNNGTILLKIVLSFAKDNNFKKIISIIIYKTR